MTNPTEPAVSSAERGRGPGVLQDVLPLEYAALNRPRASSFRWVILTLVFLAITINYIDRLVMGILAKDLQALYHINDIQYGYIQSAFALSYAAGQLASGAWLDKVGTRIGYTISLLGWSVASMLHALARGVWGFGIMRGFLGITESPAYPAATKTLAEWFPRRERALAMGFVNAGSNVGAILAPLVVPWLAIKYGWQWAFIGTGGVGLVWLLLWIPIYRKPAEHPQVSAEELAYINSDPPEPTAKVRWATLLTYRQSWAFAIGKFLTDSMWWFYMTWFPKFLYDHHGLDLKTIGLPLIVVYLMADVGSIGGGWLSSSMIKRGWSVNLSRKTAMLICALGVTPVMFAQGVQGLWGAVFLLGLATACHQGFSSNLYTLVSDTFPKRAVGSVAGLGGTCGYVGATIFQIIVGYSVEKRHNYIIPFVCSGLAYLAAFAVIQWLAPRLKPVEIVDDERRAFDVIPSDGPKIS
jgi:ACS family hexuronate transporter-like MFS transporter